MAKLISKRGFAEKRKSEETQYQAWREAHGWRRNGNVGVKMPMTIMLACRQW